MLGNNLACVLKQGSKGSSASGPHRTHNLLGDFGNRHGAGAPDWSGLLLRSFQRLLQVDPRIPARPVLAMEIQQAGISFAQYNTLSLEGSSSTGGSRPAISKKSPPESEHCPA